jgi:5-methylcytosine-specific restriction protein A
MDRPWRNRLAWKQMRVRVLERDGYRCQLRYPGCKGAADTADHTLELWEGGAALDESNLVAACRPCNSRKHMARLLGRSKVSVREW